MTKPRIAILADVRSWAWARKSVQIVKYLSDEFDLTVSYLYERPPDPMPSGADLYHTYEVFQASRLPRQDIPFTTGMTAHVWPTWEAQHGPGTVRRWSENARAFHVNSMMLLRECEQLLERKIWYVPNGVDETFFRRTRERAQNQKLIVGWVGKPNPRKGGDLVREACELAEVELRVIGRTHRNALGPEEMRDFYQDIHVLAVQSNMDGTPNPALEAAACGVAVVSNRIGNMPEFIEPGVNGLLIERDADSLATALRELATDVPRVVQMGEAARATIERDWTWKKLSKNYAEMWRSCL